MQCSTEDFDLSSSLSSPCLDLARKGLTELPEETPECKQLEYLYLEGNQLQRLPGSLCTSCRNLRWLDVRNNRIAHLPASIEYLKSLKTLLLEGNCITTLPFQLGSLRQLTGLSLASNPLVFPPPHVIAKGTRAVLSYLQEKQDEEQEERALNSREEEEEKEEDEEENERNLLLPLQHVTTATDIPRGGSDPAAQSQLTLSAVPQPKLKPAPLLHHSPPPSPPITLAQGVPGRRGGHRDGRKGERRRKIEEKRPHVQPLSAEEKLQRTAIVEKQMSEAYLKQWRSEARAEHLKGSGLKLSHPRAVDTAPFATEQTHNPGHSHTKETMEDRSQDAQLGEEIAPLSQLRAMREQAVKERVEQYSRALQEQRTQARLIASPSNDLLQAERKLAEALAERELVERKLAREYRLTAFTPDPSLL